MLPKHPFAALALLCFTLLNGCNSAQRTPRTEESSFSQSGGGLETIAILGTNDLHGALAPISMKTYEAEGVTPTEYTAGGAPMISSYIHRLRSEFGSRLVWLDAGDQFQGSIESNTEYGAPMIQLFNHLKLTAAAVGNHEFDFGVDTLKARMSEAKYPYLSSNILKKGSEDLAQFPNTLPHLLVVAGKLPVGIIGLSTLETPRTTRPKNVEAFSFQDLKTATLREAKALREKGAKVIVITAHSGLKCETGRTPVKQLMKKPTDPQGDCGSQDEMVRLLRSLPAGTVDAVVSGHTHQIVHHWIAGVPVIQAGAMGRYLNVIYLTYDWQLHRLATEETRIEGPIPVCEKIFKNQGDCNGDRKAPARGRGELIAAKFHGETLHPDPQIQAMIAPTLKKSENVRKKVIGTAASPIELQRMKESELGNLMADAVRKAVNADFALVNSGGIRAPLEQGTIDYGSVFRTYPFDNIVAMVRVTMKELGLILRVAQHGARGFHAVSGLKLKLIDPKFEAPFDDLNGSGKFELWKMNRVVDFSLPNGTALNPERLYSLATIDFLVMGGDDMGWAMSQIPKERVTLDTGILARDALIRYIESAGPLDTPENPLVNPKFPRLSFVKPLLQKLGRGSKKRLPRRTQRKSGNYAMVQR